MPSAPVGDIEAWTAVLKDLILNEDRIEALRQSIRDNYEPGSPDSFASCIISHLRAIAGAKATSPAKQ